MRMKACDEEKNYSPTSFDREQIETIEMNEGVGGGLGGEGGGNRKKQTREEFEESLNCPCAPSSSSCPSVDADDTKMDDRDDDDDSSVVDEDQEEQSSKKRKYVYHGVTPTPASEPSSAAEQVDSIPPTFYALRPKLPLKTVPLTWKDVIWKGTQTMQRLLLINKETKKAYDGDFGFKILIPLVMDDKLEEPGHIHYQTPPNQAKKKQFFPVYLRRNRSIINPLTKVRTYKIPYFDSDPNELPNGIRWTLCDGDYRWEYGFSGNVKLSLIQAIFSPFYEPPPLHISHQCIQKTLLKCTFENNGFVYFDHEEIRQAACIGRSLHPDCHYGDVYFGKEYTEQVINVANQTSAPNGPNAPNAPNAGTTERRIYSKEVFSTTNVVIKVVSFDSPLSSYLYPITELSQVEDKFQKVCRTESVVHEIQAMTFLQQQLSSTNNYEDKKKTEKFYQLIHYQADNRNLFCITKGYNGGSLLTYSRNKTRFGKLTELEAKYIFKQVAEAIQLLHTFGMSHLDISPENIVFHYDHIPEMITPEIQSVLIDFGQIVAQQYHSNQPQGGGGGGSGKFMKLPARKENVGKKPFHCPELCCFHGEYFTGYAPYCAQKVDIWQLGILLYFLLTGCTPFSLACATQIDQNQEFVNWIHSLHERTIKQKEVVWRTDDDPMPQKRTTLCNTDLSGEVLSLLSDLLTLKPDQRPDIHKVLQHAWLK